MENNTAKLKAEAEARILQEMEEEEALQNEVQKKKRQYLFIEKEKLINEMLDLQVRIPFTYLVTLLKEVHFNRCFEKLHGNIYSIK